MTDPKGEKPEPDHPHEDDLSLELHPDQEGVAGRREVSAGMPSLSASTDEFHFSGPAEELDFTEPADFTFPTSIRAEARSHPSIRASWPRPNPRRARVFRGRRDLHRRIAPAGGGRGGARTGRRRESPTSKRPRSREGKEAETQVRIARLGPNGRMDRRSACSPWGPWRPSSARFLGRKTPGVVTLILNIACPLMLALIPYALWRSSARWVTPAASAVYTVMLALGTAALITGAWLMGMELSRYDWQFSKARVIAGKPRPGAIAPMAHSPTDKEAASNR